MRCKALLLYLMMACVVVTVNGQQSGANNGRSILKQREQPPKYPTKGEKLRAVAIPPESALLSVVAQTDCPLKIENPKGFYAVDYDLPMLRYQVYNRSTKPLQVKSFSVAVWHSGGGGNSWGRAVDGNVLLQPGEELSANDNDYQLAEIPLTDELRDKLQLRGRFHGVGFIMIETITFADGTTYNAKPLSDALHKHFFDDCDCRVDISIVFRFDRRPARPHRIRAHQIRGRHTRGGRRDARHRQAQCLV